MRRPRVCAGAIVVGAFWAPGPGTAGPPAGQHLLVSLDPPVAGLYESASVAIRGASAASGVEVRLQGASTGAAAWTSLDDVHGVWRGRLEQPALLGAYPLEIEIEPRGTRFVSSAWLLRVYSPGTLARPSFASAWHVAAWWVSAVRGGTLVAVRPWPLPRFDHRDARLHRLFVVAYSLPGHTGAAARHGIWITAVRDRYAGRWRLLEAALTPG